MARSLSLLIVLFVFWLLLSGFFTPFLVAAGFGSALAVVWLSRRLGLVDAEAHPIGLLGRALFSYWPWLVKEIVVSAWTVTKIILHPRLPISPTLVEFRPLQKTDLGLVIHANSITLTPGTISIEVEPQRFLVHALTSDGAAGLAGSEMDSRCRALESAS